MSSRMIFCHVPASKEHSEATRKFYDKLLVRDPIRSLRDDMNEYHVPSSAGVQLGVGEKRSLHHTVTCYFAVDNLQDALRNLMAAGAKVVSEPWSLKMKVPVPPSKFIEESCKNRQFFVDPEATLGEAVLLRDPGGNLVGIVQLAKTAEIWFQGHVTPAQIEDYHEGAINAGKVFGN